MTCTGIEDQFVNEFIEAVHTTLLGMRQTFSKCRQTEAILQLFEKTVLPTPDVQRKLIEKWQETMRPLYEVVENDLQEEADVQAFLTAIEQIPILKDLNLTNKWRSLDKHARSRQEFLNHMKTINGLAGLDGGIPRAVKTNISQVVNAVSHDLRSGRQRFEELKAPALGERVLSQTSKKDQKHLENHLDDVVRGVSTFAKRHRNRNKGTQNYETTLTKELDKLGV